LEAALDGSREVGFTVLSMSLSLIAVFIPILLMGGIVGRLFREFALTLSIAILISLFLSLTLTPMMCSLFLKPEARPEQSSRGFNPLAQFLHGYERTVGWALRHSVVVMVVLLATVGLNVYLFKIVPKGFFPQQDTGFIIGTIQADQTISFEAMRQKLTQLAAMVQADPSVETVRAYTGAGAGQTNVGILSINLKPKSERGESVDELIDQLRGKLSQVPGAQLFLQAVQDIRARVEGKATPNINTRCKGKARMSFTPSCRASLKRCRTAKFSPTLIPISSKVGLRPMSPSIATPPRALASS
jgi:multidrug efflux pump